MVDQQIPYEVLFERLSIITAMEPIGYQLMGVIIDNQRPVMPLCSAPETPSPSIPPESTVLTDAASAPSTPDAESAVKVCGAFRELVCWMT
jgi:hypothetical protein